MSATTDFSRTRTINGVEHVARECGRCGGRGYIEYYGHVHNGVCFECNGVASTTWEPREAAEKREARNARARERRAEQRAAEAERKAQEQAAEHLVWLAEHTDLAARLKGYQNAGGRNQFITEMAEQAAERQLTERQTAAVEKALDAEIAKAARTIEVPEGRQQVEGVIRTIRVEEDVFSPYGGTTIKMLVKVTAESGEYRLWGTMPSALAEAEAEKGDTVRLTATLKPSNEIGFGFMSRPAKAEIVEKAGQPTG